MKISVNALISTTNGMNSFLYFFSSDIQKLVKATTILFAMGVNVNPLGLNLFRQACAPIQNKPTWAPPDGGKFPEIAVRVV